LPSWGNALTTVAACGVVGAFIDFYIGKRGQQRVKGWLETWWLRLSDVRQGNFGREEALFAVQILDGLFGRRLFSVRRITAIAVITSGSLCVMLALFRLKQIPFYGFWSNFIRLHILLNFILIVLSVGASLSITRFAASRVAYIITKAPHLNFLGFAFLLILQYVMFAWWSPNIITLHSLISDIFLFKEIGLKIDYYYDVIDVGPLEFVNDRPTIIPSPLYSLTLT
jgi:hypothetical protein